MSQMINFSVLPLSVTDKEAFSEASAQELRVLLALIERNGRVSSEEELAALAKTSTARCASAIVFWQSSGVISKGRDTEEAPKITEEFEARINSGEISEVSAVETASVIRNNDLADMITECTALMGRATLSSSDVKQLTGLYEQYKLSAEYIVTLAAYLAERGKLSVTKLVNKAIELDEKEIDTTEALETYMAERESENEADFAFRKIFGIYGRSPARSEKEAFSRWSKTYGYFTEIVGEAYDIAVSKVTRGHVAYADRILSRWYERGCRTLAECRAQYEADEAEKREKYEESKNKRQSEKKEKKERYGDFDVRDAFMKALDRSYGADSDT